MRNRILCLIAVAGVVTAGLVALGGAQENTVKPAPPKPPTGQPKTAPQGPPLASNVQVDAAKFPPLQRQVYFSARSGVGWLQRANAVNGRFNYVSTPSLWVRIRQQEPYPRKAAAAVALAKSARYFGDERSAAQATQTILTLLVETAPDAPGAPQYRYPTAPSANRLAAAGLLARAISELPNPQADLLDQAELLCRYLYRQQRPDGSLTSAADLSAAGDEDGHAAEALHGLLRSCQQRPVPWKLEVVRKAFAFYQPRWRAKKNLTHVPRFTAAYAEAYALTRDQVYADAVFEMNDWLCQLQYQQFDQPTWLGGFRNFADGKILVVAPDVHSANYVEALADACRVARQTGDARRHPRYVEAVEKGLRFVTNLQFTEGNTKHFSDGYRDEIKGAFYASPEDGNLRLDFTQQAVCAMLQYLAYEGAASR